MTIEDLREKAESMGIKVDKRWGEARLAEEIEAVATTEPDITPPSNGAEYVQQRAMAIWAGQSISLPTHERKSRIIKALAEKGLDVEGIQWPV